MPQNAHTAMLLFSEYPDDPRPRREAEALIQEGFLVDIICLCEEGQLSREQVNGVNVHRINLKHKAQSKMRYLFEYSYFISAAFLKLTWLHLYKNYDIIHVHNMPEVLVISATFPKLTRAKILLDLHDPMPELFRTIFSVSENHPMIRALKWLEKFCIWFADSVITPNISFRNTFISRGCPPKKIHTIMNSPQENIFQASQVQASSHLQFDPARFNIMFHGIIEERQGIDLAIEAVSNLRNKIRNIALHIFGKGTFLKKIQQQVRDLNLEKIVTFHGSVPLEGIAKALSCVDLGIVPNRRSPFTELNLPTRIFECLAMGKPVIAPRTQGIRDYFDEESLFFFEPGSTEDLASKIFEVYMSPSKRKQIIAKGMEVYLQYTWAIQKVKLLKLYKYDPALSKHPAGFNRLRK